MIYDVRQTTTYTYASGVSAARHVLRLLPIPRPGQRVVAAALDIRPAPVERRDGTDFFGNRVTHIALDHAHDRLEVEMLARIIVDPPEPLEPGATPAWESVRDDLAASRDLGPAAPLHFLFPSRHVTLDPEIRDWVEASFAPGRPVLDAALALTQRFRQEFSYDTAATNVATTAPMSFALRRGVCQDFAHIMIAGLRGLGIPAAYVSGYLRTVPPPGQKRLEGADAMHAWVLVWCGEAHGWRGLDPTNGIAAGVDHIQLAVGRDYADVAPVDGVVLAAGAHQVAVSVDVVGRLF